MTHDLTFDSGATTGTISPGRAKPLTPASSPTRATNFRGGSHSLRQLVFKVSDRRLRKPDWRRAAWLRFYGHPRRVGHPDPH